MALSRKVKDQIEGMGTRDLNRTIKLAISTQNDRSMPGSVRSEARDAQEHAMSMITKMAFNDHPRGLKN
ncbi:hypothetical protein [Streptomyces cavernicola]|uniref:Uncharacterized protein n=1 Tax=Streptomyces cavernicola TaxID=3043613 RepID=A0ABT6SLP3_9ACTN|nr:hypothetical protein [Streptomyces sp. B-S-A6]MDI3408323.1 hypothetical protein [Streptomyces sp. B-S-A6]